MPRQSGEPSIARPARFQTTSWSLVARAGDDDPDGRAAIEHLCRTYWPPLYSFLRISGKAPADAEDLLQGFFIHVLERGVFGYAEQDRGRFRTFLIAALKQFVAREYGREHAQRRRPEKGFVPLDVTSGEVEFSRRCRSGETPEAVFERAWALTLLDQARQILCDEYERAGKVQLFNTLVPSLAGDGSLESREVAQQLQMSDGAVRVAVHRLRQRYGTILRRLIVATLHDDLDVEDELKSLMDAVANKC